MILLQGTLIKRKTYYAFLSDDVVAAIAPHRLSPYEPNGSFLLRLIYQLKSVVDKDSPSYDAAIASKKPARWERSSGSDGWSFATFDPNIREFINYWKEQIQESEQQTLNFLFFWASNLPKPKLDIDSEERLYEYFLQHGYGKPIHVTHLLKSDFMTRIDINALRAWLASLYKQGKIRLVSQAFDDPARNPEQPDGIFVKGVRRMIKEIEVLPPLPTSQRLSCYGKLRSLLFRKVKSEPSLMRQIATGKTISTVTHSEFAIGILMSTDLAKQVWKGGVDEAIDINDYTVKDRKRRTREEVEGSDHSDLPSVRTFKQFEERISEIYGSLLDEEITACWITLRGEDGIEVAIVGVNAIDYPKLQSLIN